MSDEINCRGLKEEELRKHAVCALCHRKIGQTKMPMFYLVTIERHGLDLNALKRQQGLGMMLGSGTLAMVMGEDADMTVPLMNRKTLMVCEECSTEGDCVIPRLAGEKGVES